MESGEIEAGEILSLLDQRILSFKDFDPTASLTDDGQYGSFISAIGSNDAPHVNGHTQNGHSGSSRRHGPIRSPLQAHPLITPTNIDLPQENHDINSTSQPGSHTRASRPNPHHNSNPRYAN
jgi:hypothetical protein